MAVAACSTLLPKITCLYRLQGRNSPEVFELKEDKQKVLIGRSPECDICLSSIKLSRKHAEMVQLEPRLWSITDLGSTNGIWIDGRRLNANSPYTLKDRDKIEFGKDALGNTQAEFVYQFYKLARVQKRGQSGPSEEQLCKLQRLEELLQQKEQRFLQKIADYENLLKEKEEGMQKVSELEEKLRQTEGEKVKERERLETLEKVLKEKEESEANLLQLQEELSKKEEENRQRLLQMENEHKKMEEQIRQKEISEQEKELLLQEQMRKAEEEKVRLEKDWHDISTNLQKEMQTKDEMIQEKEESLKQLKESQARAQEELRTLENEKTTLEAQGSGFKATIEEMMESELVCAICSELFVQAVSLNCSHSYCQLCISRWIKTKKECPQCRAHITSKVRSLVLDNYIDKISDFLSQEMKENRQKLVAERKEEQSRFDKGQTRQMPAPRPNAVGSPDVQVIIIDDTGPAPARANVTLPAAANTQNNAEMLLLNNIYRNIAAQVNRQQRPPTPTFPYNRPSAAQTNPVRGANQPIIRAQPVIRAAQPPRTTTISLVTGQPPLRGHGFNSHPRPTQQYRGPRPQWRN